jgi:glycosyltransferase involved in cell wall biosynthesis
MARRSVLFIADTFYPHEIPPEGKTNTFLALALGRRGWDVAVWAGRDARLPASSVNVRIVRSAKFWGLSEILRILLWLIINRPRQVVIMYHVSFYSCRPDINWIPIMARILGVRCVTLFSNGGKPHRSKMQDHVLPLVGYDALRAYPIGLLGVSEKIVFHCASDRIRLLGSDPCNLKVNTEVSAPPQTLPVSGLTDTIALRTSLGLSNADFLVGNFGQIYPGKGIEWLLEAVSFLKHKGVDVKLVLLGPTNVETAHEGWNVNIRNYAMRLKNMVRDLDIEDITKWCGFYEDSLAARCISTFDVACLPFDEGVRGLRSSFVTCAEIGVPIITTRTPETDLFLLESDSGIIFVEPRNSAQIADSILLFYNHREKTGEHGLKLKNFAKKHFSNERFVDCFDAA